MNIEVQTILKQNITIVFDSLDLHDIDTSELKKLMGRDVPATIMDTPEMIVAVLPPAPTIIQIDNRRIRIHLPKNTTKLGEVPIWALATESTSLVPIESTALAYGFNYDVGATIDGTEANEFLIERFVPSPETLNQKLDGVLFSTVPRFRFHREENRYDLVLEPGDGNRIKVHLNAHFELSEQSLPTSEAMQKAYKEEYNRFIDMLPRILED